MPEKKNKSNRTTFYYKTRIIVKYSRFGRFQYLDGFADMPIGNWSKG
jgi:hypothetical protein